MRLAREYTATRCGHVHAQSPLAAASGEHSPPAANAANAALRPTHLPAGVFAAYQAELRRLSLACLSDLPLLARRLLAAGGKAQRWARERWQ